MHLIIEMLLGDDAATHRGQMAGLSCVFGGLKMIYGD